MDNHNKKSPQHLESVEGFYKNCCLPYYKAVAV